MEGAIQLRKMRRVDASQPDSMFLLEQNATLHFLITIEATRFPDRKFFGNDDELLTEFSNCLGQEDVR
jgi:hypothetical protein